MHTSDAKRVAEIPKADRNPGIANLPEETHIVSGTIEGHGATSLASEKAKISGRIISLDRTESGGIKYQVAVYVSEPILVEPPKPPTDEERAIAYLSAKGNPNPKDDVAKYGVARILDMMGKEAEAKEKALSAELAKKLGL